jgi:hypothetical protein
MSHQLAEPADLPCWIFLSLLQHELGTYHALRSPDQRVVAEPRLTQANATAFFEPCTFDYNTLARSRDVGET